MIIVIAVCHGKVLRFMHIGHGGKDRRRLFSHKWVEGSLYAIHTLQRQENGGLVTLHTSCFNLVASNQIRVWSYCLVTLY